MLYLVGTPIGNLEDITLRALRVLREVPLIAAEDTRITRRLLQRYDIKTRITSFHDHSGDAKLGQLVEHMRTLDLALVSEAGMPNISDPGHDLRLPPQSKDSITCGAHPGPDRSCTSAVAVSGSAHCPVHLSWIPAQKGLGAEEAVGFGATRGSDRCGL